MNSRDASGANIARWVFRLVIAAVVVYLLWRVRATIITVLLAAVLAAALEPVVSWLCRFRIRLIHPKTQRLLASFLVFSAFIALIIGMFAWFAAPVGQEFRKLRPEVLSQVLTDFSHDIQSVYASLPPFAREVIAAPNEAAISQRLTTLVETAFRQATAWLSHLLEVFVIPVLAFYFVVDSLSLKKLFISFLRKPYRSEAMRVARDGGRVFRTYIGGQIILCLIAGVVMGALLAYWDVKYALTLAVLAGVTRAVPIVGPIFSGAIIFLIILASNIQLAITVLVIFSILHFVESKVLMPVLLGDMMRLHPALLLVSILVAYEFFGILGMFLAAPVTAMGKTLIVRYYLERRDRGSGTGGGAASSDLEHQRQSAEPMLEDTHTPAVA